MSTTFYFGHLRDWLPGTMLARRPQNSLKPIPRHVGRLREFIEKLELSRVTAFVQDWGSLIGLNMIGNHTQRFARVVVGDGALPLVPEGEMLFERIISPVPPTGRSGTWLWCHWRWSCSFCHSPAGRENLCRGQKMKPVNRQRAMCRCSITVAFSDGKLWLTMVDT